MMSNQNIENYLYAFRNHETYNLYYTFMYIFTYMFTSMYNSNIYDYKI